MAKSGKATPAKTPEPEKAEEVAKVEKKEVEKKDEKAAKTPSPQKKILGAIPVPGFVVLLVSLALQAYAVFLAMQKAYTIRLIPLTEYGMLIHEFDPWFNFRATQYMLKNGWNAFFSWFDYQSWYPLGRPVGSTTYPGLQFTACAIHWVLRKIGKPWRMSINDICCLMPCWGGAAATLFIALLTYETTKSRTAGVVAAGLFSIIPGHLMRSMGGGFDNECIAMLAMLMTFYLWVRSLRSPSSWWIGIFAGLAYGYMVAAWGGFTFVLNMVSLHACVCLVVDLFRNAYTMQLYRSYTLFFIIGTFLATRVPPVGMNPFKSLEQLSGLFAFVVFQTLALAQREMNKKGIAVRSFTGVAIRLKYVLMATIVVGAVVAALYPTGWFGPLSSRVRGLFVKHTVTGNPLVDSVAEHQPANDEAYWRYLHYCIYGWAAGAVLPLFPRRVHGTYFLAVYALVAYYFCQKMSRLILLAAPIACMHSGAIIGLTADWIWDQFYFAEADDAAIAAPASKKEKVVAKAIRGAKNAYRRTRLVRLTIAVAIIATVWQQAPPYITKFVSHSEQMAQAFSNPQIVFKATVAKKPIIVKDYVDAYNWVKKKTPEDSRIMAWWDYGYQITGIGNRTTIADGNTWNHEHIATLGKCLTSPVKEAHSLIRHLADYVLIWAGGGGDDLAKSPHMARIGNSVYRDICPKDDPLCSHFGFMGSYDRPTPSMKRSLLYNLASVGTNPKITLNDKMFKMVYQSTYGLVRIFKVMNVSQESKDWVADPANRVCDRPGSWYCPGQYPPAEPIQKLLKKRIDFGQLEDFNRKKKDDEYHKNYMKKMGGRK